VGSTGHLGSAICQRLRDRGLDVRGLIRKTSDLAKVNFLRDIGVETVVGNLKDRESLEDACKGVNSIISTATITVSRQPDDTIQNVDQDGQLRLVEVAKQMRVKRFVYVSFTKHIDTDSPLVRAKRAIEDRVIKSGMTFTILRPSNFMETWLSPLVGFDYANAKVTIYGSGSSKISWISRRDVSEFAVEALEAPYARNATWELGGPEALSPLQVVHIFEAASGKRFDVHHVSVESLREQLAQVTDSVQQSFTALMLDYAKGGVIDMGDVLRHVPIYLTSVKEYSHLVAEEAVR
jgi:NADH dehydrogenase